jgi:hypothetical protein
MINSDRSSGVSIWKLLDPEDEGTKVIQNFGQILSGNVA